MVDITVKTKEKVEDGPAIDREVSFSKEIAESTESAVEEHGEELVHSYFKQQAILRTQGVVRAALQQGKTDEEAVALGESYKLGQITRQAGGGGEVKKLVDKVKSGKLSREKLIAMLEAELSACE